MQKRECPRPGPSGALHLRNKPIPTFHCPSVLKLVLLTLLRFLTNYPPREKPSVKNIYTYMYIESLKIRIINFIYRNV